MAFAWHPEIMDLLLITLVNPGVPLKGSIRVPLRGSFKGSIRVRLEQP